MGCKYQLRIPGIDFRRKKSQYNIPSAENFVLSRVLPEGFIDRKEVQDNVVEYFAAFFTVEDCPVLISCRLSFGIEPFLHYFVLFQGEPILVCLARIF